MSLVEEKKDLRKVSLREVARQCGCSATNIYNYFQDLEELYSYVAFTIYRDSLILPLKEVSGKRDSRGYIEEFCRVQIDFAQNNPAWYRYIFMEENISLHQKEAGEAIKQGRIVLAEAIKDYTGKDVTVDAAGRVGDILYRYLKGAIGQFISNIRIYGNLQDHRESIMKDCFFIIDNLC